MPLYAYRCKSCGHEFEVRQRFSEDPLTDCPQCDGSVRRVISQVGIVFKGSGFYVTDNRNGKSNSYLKGGTEDGDKRNGEKSVADKNSADKSSADKSGSDKSSSPTADKSSGQKPASSGA